MSENYRYVERGLPHVGDLHPGWKIIHYRDIFKEIKRPIQLSDNKEYSLLIVKRNRGGLIEREKLLGKNIKTNNQHIVRENDFLISKRQIVHGACGVVPKKLDGSIVSNEYMIVNPSEYILIDFLKYYSHSIFFQQTCFHASIGVTIEKMIFKPEWWLKFEAQIPPLPEQKKIAQILSTWDLAIEKTDALIKEKENLKKGLMQKLLTGKVRFKEFIEKEGFKDTEIGKVPLDWDVDKIQNITAPIKGAMKVGPFGSQIKKDDMISEGIKVYGQENVIDNDFKIGDRFVSQEKYNQLKTCQLDSNDVVITMMGTGGECRVVPNDIKIGIMDSHLMRIKTNEEMISPHFLARLIQDYYLVKNQISNLSQGGIMAGLSLGTMKSVIIPIPKLEEQAIIENTLSIIDNEIDKVKKHVLKVIAQKKGLMQELLTGKTRVKIDET